MIVTGLQHVLPTYALPHAWLTKICDYVSNRETSRVTKHVNRYFSSILRHMHPS